MVSLSLDNRSDEGFAFQTDSSDLEGESSSGGETEGVFVTPAIYGLQKDQYPALLNPGDIQRMLHCGVG